MKWLKLAEVTQPGAYVRRRIGDPTAIAFFVWTSPSARLSEPTKDGIDSGYRYFGPIPEPDEYTWRWPNAEARIKQHVSVDQIGCRGLQMDIERAFELTELVDFRWQPVLK